MFPSCSTTAHKPNRCGISRLREQILLPLRRRMEKSMWERRMSWIFTGYYPNPQTTPIATISAPLHHVSRQTVGQEKSSSHYHPEHLGPGNLIINSIALTGYNPTEFTETNTCGSSLAPATSCTISITFTATIGKVPQIVDIAISDNAAGGGTNVFVVGVATKTAH